MSKEKQIEEMQTVINGAFFEDFRNGNGVCIKTISKHLYNAGYRKQGEWISVEERLPDKEGTYITYTDKEKTIIDVFCIYPSHGTKFWVGGNGKVTHWMPLPEAPKMKGGAE